MTKTPKPFNTPALHKQRCVRAAYKWAEANPTDPFAYAVMFNDLYLRIEQFGTPEEIEEKANALIKAKHDALAKEGYIAS